MKRALDVAIDESLDTVHHPVCGNDSNTNSESFVFKKVKYLYENAPMLSYIFGKTTTITNNKRRSEVDHIEQNEKKFIPIKDNIHDITLATTPTSVICGNKQFSEEKKSQNRKMNGFYSLFNYDQDSMDIDEMVKCIKCATTKSSTNFRNCSFCSHSICRNCLIDCISCNELFCMSCSTIDYTSAIPRNICIDCSYNSKTSTNSNERCLRVSKNTPTSTVTPNSYRSKIVSFRSSSAFSNYS